MAATGTQVKQHSPKRVNQNGQSGRQEPASAPDGPAYVYDPLGVARVERLRLARQWAQQGAIYQAIFAYADMLIRYPCQGAADAASEELLELVRDLERQGLFYTVLDTLRKVEQGSYLCSTS